MAIKKKYAALGRGLDALISTEKVNTAGSGSINEIPIEQIFPNPNQPRREFDPVALQELSDSIRELGIVQPITLRDQGDGTYLIIAGERRWRASQMAGLEAIPAYVRTVDDENMMEMALIENIQREDLNALEIALAYQHLLEQYADDTTRAAVVRSIRAAIMPIGYKVTMPYAFVYKEQGNLDKAEEYIAKAKVLKNSNA